MTERFSRRLPNRCHQFTKTGSCSYGSRCKFFHETTADSLHLMLRNALTLDDSDGRQRLTQLFKSLGDPRVHIRTFFDGYDGFDYQPSKPVMGEFYRMCEHYEWSRLRDKEGHYLDPEREAAGQRFKDALTLQFNAIYGTDENDLVGWQNLCVVLNLKDIPEELYVCRDLVRSMYVNIVDLVDVPVTLEFAEHFKTETELSKYTRKHGKYFPLENAYAGGLLKFLLRRIRVPRQDAIMHHSYNKYLPGPVITSPSPGRIWTSDQAVRAKLKLVLDERGNEKWGEEEDGEDGYGDEYDGNELNRDGFAIRK